MRPWIKDPIDLVRRDPALARIRLDQRATFYELYRIARRDPEDHLGFLVDDRLLPFSLRKLSTLTAINRQRLARHIEHLRDDHGLLAQTLGGRLLVPLVVVIERRLAYRPSPNDLPQDDLPPRPSPKRASRKAVETPPPTPLLDASGWVIPGPSPPKMTPPHPIEPQSESETYVTASPNGASVENLVGAYPQDLDDLVPRSITSDRARFLIAKLASASAVWAQVLVSRRDRATLNRLFAQHRGGLLAALEQASFEPGAVRNAGAWLSRVVPTIEQEAS